MDGDVTLEKLDQVRARVGASYRDCHRALEEEHGDVPRAIVRLEQAGSCAPGSARPGDAARQRIRKLLTQGARTRIAVRQDDRLVCTLPALAGLAGAVIFPAVAAASVIAALATRSSISLEPAARA